MDKPRFIRGLLEEVGTAINPITLVRRIPEGLEIEGLREGLSRMIREYEIQYSISGGVARVLRGEVATAQDMLRSGQRKGVKFDVVNKGPDHLDVESSDIQSKAGTSLLDGDTLKGVNTRTNTFNDTMSTAFSASGIKSKDNDIHHDLQHTTHKPGHCVACHSPFSTTETETLVGFACGHVFHLSHLLHFLNPEENLEELEGEGMTSGDGVAEWEGRSVSAKVTHARLLRDRISEGCPVCVGKENGFVVNGFSV